MATLKAELREILERYEIDPRDKSKLWDCHGTLVLYHRAYEIIAAREGITFDPPTMIEHNGAAGIVAMLVVGHWKERAEWSVGEAAPNNSKNAYPYAIAEKRAKDRVIAKLVGLAEHVYSEDEAEEFKEGRPLVAAPAEKARDATSTASSRIPSATSDAPEVEIARGIYKRLREALRSAAEPKIVDSILSINDVDFTYVKRFAPTGHAELLTIAAARKTELLASA